MSNLPSRRRGSSVSRSAREKRAFQLVVAGGSAAVVAVVALVLAIAGVVGSGLFFLALIVAVVCAVLFRRTVAK
jgi:F0F1-type ATP synthase assembly protein I